MLDDSGQNINNSTTIIDIMAQKTDTPNLENSQQIVIDDKIETKADGLQQNVMIGENFNYQNEMEQQILSKQTENDLETQDLKIEEDCANQNENQNQNNINQQEGAGQEALIYNSQQWQEISDGFFENFPNAKNFASQIGKEIINNPQIYNNTHCLELAYAKIMEKSYVAPCDIINSQDFREKYVFNNEEIKSSIIENYLKQLDAHKPPKSIMTRGQIILTPPDKIGSIQQAGTVIKQMLQNRRI